MRSRVRGNDHRSIRRIQKVCSLRIIEFLTGKGCRIVSAGLLWLDLVQQGDLEVKPVSTWRNAADLSTVQVLLNLMGFVGTHQDYTPVGG